MEKRSFSLSGHRTSVALEPEFWLALEEIASTRGRTLSGLVTEIDSTRETGNLASAIRLAILAHYRAKSSDSIDPA